VEDTRPISALLSRAAVASGQEAWFEAATYYAEALGIEPSAPILVQYGHMLKECGLLEEAASAYRAALEYDSTDADARVHLAHLLKRLDRPHEALAILEQLAVLPNAPHVAPEIAALKVAMANEWICRRRPLGADRTLVEAPQALKEANAKATARIDDDRCARQRSAAQVGRHRLRDYLRELRSFAVKIPIHPEPQAHLVIEDGHLKATTSNPRFRLDFTGPTCASDLAGWWVDLRLKIEAPDRVVDPVIFVEHAPAWADFTALRLRSEGDGVFRAVLRLRGPVLSLRLDPLHSPGQFLVANVRLVRLTWLALLARTFAKAPKATLHALFPAGYAEKKASVAERLQAIYAAPPHDDYQRWIILNERSGVSPVDGTASALTCGLLLYVEQGGLTAVAATVASLRGQSHANWHLSAIVGPRTPRRVRDFLEAEAAQEPRLSVLLLDEEDSLSACLMAGYRSLSVGLVAHLVPGDRLAEGALAAFARAFANIPVPRLVYCDDDVIEADGRRHSPRFKPDWNPDYILSYDYIGRTAVFSAEAFSAVGGYRDKFPGVEDYDLLLRLTAGADKTAIRHIPSPLWHRGGEERPRDARGVVAEVIAANGVDASVQAGIAPGTLRIIWPMPSPAPHVSVIIPTRDCADFLKRSVGSILERTTYPSFEIIVIDNGSVEDTTLSYFNELRATGRVSVLAYAGPFNYSRLNNLAVATARGSMLALVNNDVEVIEDHWLAEMVSIATRPTVGAVGAKLLYGNGSVQHAGIIGGVGTVAAHAHKHFPGDAPGYMNRLVVEQAVLAVTGACLVVGTDKFLAVGGLDEDNLAVAFNDVDLCLKLAANGWRTVFTPWARLYHHESLSRGFDTTKDRAMRFAKEAAFMTGKWGNHVLIDRFYSPHLTHCYEDYSLAVVDND